ncbi:putative Histidine kinase [Verrucomicrobia bacterium]|nr:putative Histidine kinase [Verrucomicrobiota bacterium]
MLWSNAVFDHLNAKSLRAWWPVRLRLSGGKPGVGGVFLIAASLLVVSLAAMYWTGAQAIGDHREIASDRATLQQLEEILSTLKDAETGQRGYLLTGSDDYLTPYRQALAKVRIQQSTLQLFAKAGTLPASQVQSLIRLSQEKLAELEQTIQLRRSGGLTSALALVRSGEGKATMDKIRTEVARMSAAEEIKLQRALERATWAVSLRTATYVVMAIFNLGVLAWAYRRMTQEILQREAAVVETHRQKELLATTLASIGDAVIATDAKGAVTFLNSEAERLTGWKSAEAAGQQLPAVFRIINQDTREALENPVDKVIRHGTVVGLANHSLLVSKSGEEIPIDDSAAPIRQPGSALSGVVLVFRDISARRRSEEAVQEAHAQLADHSAHLEKLVEERTAKLREMINELQHVSYALTHDMRAPLRAMSAFAAAILEEVSTQKPSTPLLQDYCGRIVAAAGRLDKLILDSLNYTKAVLQQIPLQPVELSTLVASLIETYPNLQPDKADILVEGGLPVVWGEESLLTQCFSNLLGNAVKFVPPGVRPRVRVRALTSDGTARITIEDNGIGIVPEAQHRLFSMFERLTAGYEGTGIGLAIVRKVVERMGGKVGAESEAGKGSRFWVELRLAQDRAE